MKTNEELRREVMDEIKWDPELRNVSTEIGVSAKNGVITLSGEVDTYSKKLSAEKAAHRALGVRVVACDIEVKVGSIGKLTDMEVAESVRSALGWNSAVNEGKIELKVNNGWVYLDGTVDFEYKKRYAQECVKDLPGVRGVTNYIDISIKAKPIDTTDIPHKITEAYQRSVTMDSSSIKVETPGSKVTLGGAVRSWAEKEEAENIALATQAVMSVDNKIES